MRDLSAQQQDRVERMWDAFERGGLLRDAVLNGAARVRVRWRRPTAAALGMLETRVPVVVALEHELEIVARGDVLDVDDERYSVIGIERDGFGRIELRLEKQA